LKIRLIGDHSSYHCGSAAAFSVIRREVLRHGDIVEGGSFDLLIVNGEGSMHHGSNGFRRKMKSISQAIDKGKEVALINTVWQANPPEVRNYLEVCRQLVVREILSAEEMRSLGVHPKVSIDQSYFFPIENDEFIDFKGSIVFTDFWSREFDGFVRLNSKWAQRFDYIDMQSMTWSTLVRSLRTASLLITGRHHAVYAACKARTPFLALQGNTHKIEGLIATAGISIPVFRSFSEIKADIMWPETRLPAYEALFDWMELQRPWSLDQ